MATALILTGCVNAGWQTANVDAWENPALRGVYLRGSAPLRPDLVSKGSVEVEVEQPKGSLSPQDTCDQAMRTAMLELFRRSRAVGGNTVYDVETRGSRHWLSRLVCKDVLEPKKHDKDRSRKVKSQLVRMRGIAVYDPRLASGVGEMAD